MQHGPINISRTCSSHNSFGTSNWHKFTPRNPLFLPFLRIPPAFLNPLYYKETEVSKQRLQDAAIWPFPDTLNQTRRSSLFPGYPLYTKVLQVVFFLHQFYSSSPASWVTYGTIWLFVVKNSYWYPLAPNSSWKTTSFQPPTTAYSTFSELSTAKENICSPPCYNSHCTSESLAFSSQVYCHKKPRIVK